MIQVNDKTKCCGCNACIQIFPEKCISRAFDSEGFLYPRVHEKRCIGCGACEVVCPIKNPHIGISARYKHPAAYAAYYKNEAVRIDSTSGGIWGALADYMLEEGAYISGAVFDKDFLVTHIITKEKSLMAEIRSSKYLQSDTRSLYSDVKNLLAIGEKVFVCATPCQIAGLYKFLEKDYDNLYTADLICKAVPSPKVFKAYLSCLEDKNESKIKSVKFKYKDGKHPWGFSTTKIDFENDRVYIKNAGYDNFLASFLRTGLTVRPSCFECGFATYPRTGDVTLGDCWGIEHFLPDIKDREKGYSLVLVNSEKGATMLRSIRDRVFLEKVDIGKAKKWNANLMMPYCKSAYEYKPDEREKFYRDLDEKGWYFVNKNYIKCPANFAERVYKKITGSIW